ncbi:MAG: DinB family protein [Ilumatobacteraceae bacterium]
MGRRPVPPDQIVTVLGESPQRIAAITSPLTPDAALRSPAPGEWSANEVLAHLRCCADVWGGCIATIVRGDRPTIRAVNPTTYIHDTDYVDRPFASSLRAFAAQRTDLLAVLESLVPEHWALDATVTGAGAPLTRSVHAYAERLSTHERAHWKQLAKIVRLLT